MNKINYQKALEDIIADIVNTGKKKSLLLHCCCAPCASYVLTYLKDYFDITAFYFNPNITDEIEYKKRLDELVRLTNEFGIKVIDGGFDRDNFFIAVKGYENAVEGGERCSVCYSLRLEETAKLCQKNGYDYFCSTLSISPLKDVDRLNKFGEEFAKKYGATHLPNDFKKKNGYLKSIELSKKYDLYRQNYCGCEFSKRD